MFKHLKKYKATYTTLVILIGVILFLYQYPPDTVVEMIGVKNSYLATFMIATLGGLNSLTSSVFYAAVATFSAGGANPWLLGLVGGIGISIGDSIIFGLFKYGLQDITGTWKQRIDRVREYLDRYPRWTLYVVLFFVLGISPLPNDITMFALVTLGFQYRNIAPLLVLAGITITTITAHLGQSVTSYFF